MKNKLKALLGVDYPILQGPMGGGLSTATLVSEVSNLGGLGGYGAYQLQPEEIRKVITDIKAHTTKPYNINLWVNDVDDNTIVDDETYHLVVSNFKPYFDQLHLPIPEKPQFVISKFESQVEVLLQENIPVFSFVFGVPDQAILKEFKKRNIVTIGAATTLDEALFLESAEVDMIVASGFEAGGHRPSFLKPAEKSLHGTFSLIQQIAGKINLPVIAAGGITNRKSVEAAIKLGASGVQVGTAFLACQESGASNEYRDVLFSERARYTSLTKSFTGRLARGISGSISEDVQINYTLPFPLQTHFMSTLRKAAIEQGRPDLITFWAGQGVSELCYKNVQQVFESLIL
ncbi:NAD(P)H-dependent flavin oxidoreductase [Flavobacterium sedimenticola]|uniref:Propionate 3-nitronate monooxygenase n=1 Tax=Flavobacterium sedimenticola TaxID=3043286 RepID=A0ABT6XS75_9FLAO|nr:nitronate monooxygenase [Flavobacterium sedimenticola]MDI9257930.1 nitronate monooxygenase [Flavobacterium sedimenticola]